jgi:multisubunit Na+/H+ antiporter MnhE subunit
MESLRYWMVFQILLGIWLIVSPFALGFREITSMTVNDVILGAVVAILGLAVAITGLPEIKHPEKKTT